MKIVGVTACTAGIAHTYLVKEKLVKAARDLGHEIKIETQGSIGTECELTAEPGSWQWKPAAAVRM